jgi:selenocysteine-specific elongation factor
MFVMSTAGHIDHGKSVLVQALTGIDPDRLREEKERGMTIDLGFAWLKLPNGQEVGIVDVPGHERFIGNMLAGVGGVDLVLMVVAANEGVMPQTKEHIAILDLLEIKRGVVAVTKKDLVDEEWLSLVKMEVEDLLKPTTLAGSPIIPVSVINKEGLTELLAAIEIQLANTQPRKDLGRPRLPVDRIFTITGSGTIITGTLIDGSLAVGQDVEIVPKNLKSRIRGLQVHKTKSDSAQPGTRVAANLVGLSVDQIQRGDVLTHPGWLVPTTLVTGRLRLLGYLPRSLRHSTEVTFYTGAAQVLAKVRLLEGDELKPGETAWAQFVLENPIAMVNGDHYIIRSTTDTLGGGKIIDAHAKRLRRRQPDVLRSLKVKDEGTLDEVILSLLTAKQLAETGDLLSRSQLPAGDANAVIDDLIAAGGVVTIGQGEHRLLMTAAGWEGVVKTSSGFLQEYHKKYPLRPGMPREELRNKLKMGSAGLAVLLKLVEAGNIAEEGTDIRLPPFHIQLNATQQAKISAFLDSLAKSPYTPPADLIPEPDLLNLLVAQGKVVKVAEGLVFSIKAYNEMLGQVTAHLKANGNITLGEARDLLHTSRKYAQGFMEYLDSRKITRRVGDDRVLYQGQ